MPRTANASRARKSTKSDPTFGITPMLATLGALPSGDEWSYEIKWDGMRVLVRLDEYGARILTRNGIEATARFPEIAKQAARLGISRQALPLLFDGEIIAFNELGVPDFGKLQRRIQLSDPAEIARAAEAAPIQLAVFDLPAMVGRRITQLPYCDRRRLLEQLDFAGDVFSLPRAYDDGQKLLERMISSGMEGVVAKLRDGKYLPGRRTHDWTKVKCKPRQEFVVGGLTRGTGRRSSTFGALLLGAHESRGGPLTYVGNVGSGFSDQDLDTISALLQRVERVKSPFDGKVEPDDAQFVKPEIVVEVEYQEFTADRRLRQPIFKGLRADKPAADVVLEGSGVEV